ncbi:MAG: hypothetical protein JSV16_08620, partial [Candidatus Hydrogenedentota bacterium]
HNEYMIQYLPEACPVIVQARLLKAISEPADTDLYFLKHLGSAGTWPAFALIIGLVLVSGFLYLRALRRGEKLY